jgi:hypothetical protein
LADAMTAAAAVRMERFRPRVRLNSCGRRAGLKLGVAGIAGWSPECRRVNAGRSPGDRRLFAACSPPHRRVFAGRSPGLSGAFASEAGNLTADFADCADFGEGTAEETGERRDLDGDTDCAPDGVSLWARSGRRDPGFLYHGAELRFFFFPDGLIICFRPQRSAKFFRFRLRGERYGQKMAWVVFKVNIYLTKCSVKRFKIPAADVCTESPCVLERAVTGWIFDV